jgi:tetraacyldisaccharide 4'-kinase
MRPPAFWDNPPHKAGPMALLLTPLAKIYSALTRARLRAGPRGYRATVPVICIGNINVGGTGKTPTTIALIERLRAVGRNVHVVSRGYGGRLTDPTQVREGFHNAGDVGDEPLLLAAFASTWVARDRADGVRAAEIAGAEVVLMDDGFQNPSIIKDLSIVVVDAHRGFGNARVIPAGPLREPVATGLDRADILLSIGSDTAQDTFTALWQPKITCPHTPGHLRPLQTGMDWQNLDVLAFAGIGHPEKFFRTLKELGANLLGAQALDDHQPLSEPLMRRLESDATALNAQLVTTEKDAVRLPDAYRAKVLTVPVRLQINDWNDIDAALMRIGAYLT